MMKKIIMNVIGKEIAVIQKKNEDYICLTHMVKGMDDGSALIEKWLRNKNTIEFLGVWEKINNPDFNVAEYNEIMNAAGLNRFVISVKQWIARTNARGIQAAAGRYGGTYAHKDIAFEFGSWINPTFKLYLITEYQNLKLAVHGQKSLEWDVKRVLSKVNYSLQTDAVKECIIPRMTFGRLRQRWIYADEADMLNLIIFGCTAKDWERANPELKKQGLNVRSTASINQLVVLSNIEAYNAELIKQGMTDISKRRPILHKAAKEQILALDARNADDRFKKIDVIGDNHHLLK